MIIIIALFAVEWTVIYLIMKKKNSEYVLANVTFSLVASMSLASVIGVITSLIMMSKVEDNPDHYDISVRERPIVSLRTLDGTGGEFSGFLGVYGTIEGKTTYRYFVEKESGSIVPVKRDWCSFREGKDAIERVEIWMPKETFFTKYVLIGDLLPKEAHVEIVVPKGGIVRTMEVRP